MDVGTHPRLQRTAWIDELDLLRACALLAVVLIHSGGWIVGGAAAPLDGQVQALVAVARFCVPTFVLMSGLVLYRTHGGRPREPSRFLRSRWRRVLVPWLFWVPVFFLVRLASGHPLTDASGFLAWLALGPGHLYFLLLIAQLYLVMLLIPRRRRLLVGFTAVALALQLGLGWLHTYRFAGGGPWAWPLIYAAHLEAPFWVGYFTLGCLLGAEYERLRRLARFWWVALALAGGGVLLMLEVSRLVPVRAYSQGTYSYLWPSMLPMTLGVTGAVLAFGRRFRSRLNAVWPAVRGLSHHSLGIYAFHVVIVTAVGAATAGILAPLRYLILVVASLALAYPVVGALARTRLGALAVGEPGPQAGARRRQVAG